MLQIRSGQVLLVEFLNGLLDIHIHSWAGNMLHHLVLHHVPLFKFISVSLTFNVSGLEIWCIENLRLVPVPKSSHGKFYTGNAYIVLKVSCCRFCPFHFPVDIFEAIIWKMTAQLRLESPFSKSSYIINNVSVWTVESLNQNTIITSHTGSFTWQLEIQVYLPEITSSVFNYIPVMMEFIFRIL